MYCIKFSVSGQKISLISKPDVITYSQNMIYAEFSISDEWKNQKNTALFTENGNTYKLLLDENNRCLVPYEVLYSIYFYVGLIGGNLNTTNSVRVHTDKSIYRKNLNESQKENDVFGQILECLSTVNEQVEVINQYYSNTDASINQLKTADTEIKTSLDSKVDTTDFNEYKTTTDTEIDQINQMLVEIQTTPVYKSIPINVSDWSANGTYTVTYTELATCSSWDLMIDDDSSVNTFAVKQIIYDAGIDASSSGNTVMIKFTGYKPTATIVLKMRINR